MAVDKYGSMGHTKSSTTNVTNIIQPHKNFDINLDSLENVEGFNEQGSKDGIYAFKLTDEGLYTRHEVNMEGTAGALSLNDLENVKGFDKTGSADALFMFKLENGVYSREEFRRDKIVKVCKALFGEATMPNVEMENQQIGFVWQLDTKHDVKVDKSIPIPVNFKFELDFQLGDVVRVKTGGKDKVVQNIFTSGKIIGSLAPDKNNVLLPRQWRVLYWYRCCRRSR